MKSFRLVAAIVYGRLTNAEEQPKAKIEGIGIERPVYFCWAG
jgi:hypothetical protein